MSNPKHTPGPWEYDSELCAVFPPKAISGVSIAQIVVTTGEGLETDATRKAGEANARLIAAAPELLQALEHALADLKALGGRTLLAESAIRKPPAAPMNKPTRPKRYQITPKKHLSPTELASLKALLAPSRDPMALALTLLLETGARVTELLQLDASDILLDQSAVALSGIKGSMDRVIPLKGHTMLKLTEHLGGRTTGLLFDFKKRWLQDRWSNVYAPQIGTTKTLHALRHTFAIELFKVCKDLRLIQQALGHRNIENTMVYASYVYPTEQLRIAMGVS